jgi:hypothetical protein
MAQRKGGQAPKIQARTWGLACRYFVRALRLKCPVCGISPMFVPALKNKSLYDWFTPLDGCHRCGYPYMREDGYWLVPVWIIGFGFSTTVGALTASGYYFFYRPDIIPATLLGSITTAVVAFLFARQAKALFLAMDHFFDPEHR